MVNKAAIISRSVCRIRRFSFILHFTQFHGAFFPCAPVHTGGRCWRRRASTASAPDRLRRRPSGDGGAWPPPVAAVGPRTTVFIDEIWERSGPGPRRRPRAGGSRGRAAGAVRPTAAGGG